MKLRTVRIYNTLAGLCDSTTGVLLLFAPEQTLWLMGIEAMPLEPVYLQFIGVFVLGVGSSYFLPQLLANAEREERSFARHLWMLTGVVRSFVALFVVVQVLLSALVTPWLLVALVDGSLAILQFQFVRCESNE